MKRIVLCVAVSLCFAQGLDAQLEHIWVDQTKDLGRAKIVDLALQSEKGLYIATADTIYRSADLGKTWSLVFAIPRAGTNRIRCCAVSAQDIFVGTKDGLFQSRSDGTSWERVFNPPVKSQKEVACVAVFEYQQRYILVGTKGGLFLSTDDPKEWRCLSKKKTTHVAIVQDRIYAAMDGGLYYSDDKRNWERVFVIQRPDEEEPGEETAKEIDEEAQDNQREIGCLRVIDGIVFIGVDQEVFRMNEKNEIEELPAQGIRGTVNDILYVHDNSYIATTEGVFVFRSERNVWEELPLGASRTNVCDIRSKPGSDTVLWAATNKGLFMLEQAFDQSGQVDVEAPYRQTFDMIGRNPSFLELQQAAIEYNEVSRKKIEDFRRTARLKALFPKVSLGFDKGRSNNVELYTSQTMQYAITGPDDLSEGLDMSLSWDLAALVFSDDQTNIDVRSRLMVELRNDILDSLRRAYYQRMRVLYEMATNPPTDAAQRIEKELKIQEFTSEIDGLTGNYLSQWLADNSAKE